MIHKLKIEYKYWERISSGKKKFEVRYNDRDYQVGDSIEFEVIYVPEGRVVFSDSSEFKITYIHSGLGMDKNYVVLGLKLKREKEIHSSEHICKKKMRYKSEIKRTRANHKRIR